VYKSIVELVVNLVELVCVLIVAVYTLSRTKFYHEISRKKPNFKGMIFLILFFGMLSIYGTIEGVNILGAIANVRDLGPAIAGLIGGPIAGLGAGVIGAVHRFSRGGFTAIPCSLATLIAGLAGGIIYKFRKGEFITPFKALIFGISLESFHMLLVLLISRPFEQAFLLVRHIALAMIGANSLGLALFSFIILNHKKEQETRAARQRIESELNVANEIQTSMLPRIFPPFPDRKEFDIYATMDPAREVGGDFYDFFFIGEDKLCFLIGDVSGKGVPASLFMVISKTLLKTEGLRGYSPDEILSRVNSILYPDNDAHMFVTIFCVILDTKTGEIQFANGGHNPPLIGNGGRDFEFIQMPKGFVVGPMPDMEYECKKLALKPNDVIFLYTDGVTEAMNPEGQLFSDERLRQCLSNLKGKDIEDIIHGVRNEIATFAQGASQSDDITMLALAYKG
jgi:sigma-B regulation protein RsbU (phosphoserine phosphatase)